MVDRFLLPNYQQQFRRWQDYRQGTQTINEYIEEFDKLVAEESEAEGEEEGEEVYNDADPYTDGLNEVQKDEEHMLLGRSQVIQRLLLIPRVDVVVCR